MAFSERVEASGRIPGRRWTAHTSARRCAFRHHDPYVRDRPENERPGRKCNAPSAGGNGHCQPSRRALSLNQSFRAPCIPRSPLPSPYPAHPLARRPGRWMGRGSDAFRPCAVRLYSVPRPGSPRYRASFWTPKQRTHGRQRAPTERFSTAAGMRLTSFARPFTVLSGNTHRLAARDGPSRVVSSGRKHYVLRGYG
jgi:hypothetical protein